MDPTADEIKPYTVRFSESEIADIYAMTKVEAVAPAVRSIVLKAIEAHKNGKAQ